MQNILVIAPHPDDEVLGCGGTMAKHAKAGDTVFVCYATKGYTPDWSEEYLANRVLEIEESNRVLGVSGTFFLDFPTCKLDMVGQKTLNDALSKLVAEIKPEIVYIPHKGDVHMDHRLVHDAALVATRPFSVSSVKKVLAYETVSETEWGEHVDLFTPQHYEDVDGFMEAKCAALGAYASEMRPFPHPRSTEVLKALAIKRGSEAGVKSAEAFILIRSISL